MVDDWAEPLLQTARRKTAVWDLFRTARTFSLIAVPAALQAIVPSSWKSDEHPYLIITAVFAVYGLLLAAGRLLVVTVIEPGAPFSSGLVDRLSRTITWFVIALFGYFLWGIHPTLFAAGWVLCAVPILAQRYFEKTRGLRGARLVDDNYKLVGFVSGKRPWPRITGKLGNAKLYVLPENSPLGPHSVQVLPRRIEKLRKAFDEEAAEKTARKSSRRHGGRS